MLFYSLACALTRFKLISSSFAAAMCLDALNPSRNVMPKRSVGKRQTRNLRCQDQKHTARRDQPHFSERPKIKENQKNWNCVAEEENSKNGVCKRKGPTRHRRT